MILARLTAVLTSTDDMSIKNSLEAIVCLIHVKLQVSGLLWGELLSSPHLIKSDEPLDDLAFVVEIPISDFVDCLDSLDQDGMESVFGQHVHLDCIEQGDEVLGCCHDVSGSYTGTWELGDWTSGRRLNCRW